MTCFTLLNLLCVIMHMTLLFMFVTLFERSYNKIGTCLITGYGVVTKGHKHESIWANIGKSKIWGSEKQKLLGILIDQNLRFDEYICHSAKKLAEN